MCRMCCATVLPLTSDVTRMLLSQCPPLKSSFPSWETTNSPGDTSTPGAKGPDRKRWVLTETETALRSAASQLRLRIFGEKQQEGTSADRSVFSLGVGDGGVFNEGEIVGDVLVVRQPSVSPNQAVLTHRHLETEKKRYKLMVILAFMIQKQI